MVQEIVETINNVINIRNNENKHIVLTNNSEKSYKNLYNEFLNSQLRVIGGTWTDELQVKDIISDKDIKNIDKKINIGLNEDKISIKGEDIEVGRKETIRNTINGEIITIGDIDSILNLESGDINIGIKNQIKLQEEDNTIDISESKINIESDELNLKSITNIDLNTPVLNVNKEDNSGKLYIDSLIGHIELGGIDTQNTKIFGEYFDISANEILKVETKEFNINSTFKITENDKSILINSKDVTINSENKMSLKSNKIKIEDTECKEICDLSSDNILLSSKIINIKGNDNTSIKSSIVDITSEKYYINNENENTYFALDNLNNVIEIGSKFTNNIISECKDFTINTEIFNVKDNSEISILNINKDNELFELNIDNIEIKSENFNLSSSFVNINDLINIDTEDVNISSEKLKINDILSIDNFTKDVDFVCNDFSIISDTFNLATSSITFNENDVALLKLNNEEKSIEIGSEKLENINIKSSNITIGQPNQTVTILGNLITYSAGSNIITNTVLSETSAFHVHNTGTETALTVIQDNSIGTDKDLALFITNENQDRAPFRINHDGKIGMGILRNEELKAWLHLNRTDPDYNDLNNDMFLVEDQDNDTTPFIIKNDGLIGIGTNSPKYKLDVYNDSNTKGIAMNDTFYLKIDNTNKIFHNLGNTKFTNTNNSSICSFGFNLSWDVNNIVNETDIACLIFRISVKCNLSLCNGNISYRRYETFINPENFSQNNLPNEVATTDMFETTISSITFQPLTFSRVSDSEVSLLVNWINTDNVDNKLKAYLDIEIFSDDKIGDFTISKVSSINGIGNIL